MPRAVSNVPRLKRKKQIMKAARGGFGAGAWLDKGDPSYALDCVRAYNDFQTDFSSIAPDE